MTKQDTIALIVDPDSGERMRGIAARAAGLRVAMFAGAAVQLTGAAVSAVSVQRAA
ncbi:hypothetical protein [Burkholderia cenocepacia]|uniref:hypothetical protein n=1 Tax=Burkholderia cenocepacia TaxID=95486 RepID=UPI00158DCE62|nr:hypothetical protein [Burkholderia cenocepacia]MDS0850442.1 hypothetical protein [Burkholderia cenocepacia]